MTDVKKKKQAEIKIVLGGFLAILMVTLVVGYTVTAKKADKTTVTESETQPPVTSAEAAGGEDITTTLPTTAAVVTTTQAATAAETTNANGSPFNPKTVTVDENNWTLTLLNTKYKLPDNYVVTTAPAITGSSELLDSRVAPYYQKMYDAANAEGIKLTPYSGYRTLATQKRLYTNKVSYYQNQGYSSYDAQVQAAKWSMLPGCSEHNFGVAMDICSTRDDFNQTAQYKWLQQHAAEYGFIERYTEAKIPVTGVAAEPWHWRFVGVENAQKIKDSGLCLEEYLGKA